MFLQITGAVAEDLAIPDRPYSFASLQLAQAAGDAKVLADKGRPVLHLHLTDRAAGLETSAQRAARRSLPVSLNDQQNATDDQTPGDQRR